MLHRFFEVCFEAGFKLGMCGSFGDFRQGLDQLLFGAVEVFEFVDVKIAECFEFRKWVVLSGTPVSCSSHARGGAVGRGWNGGLQIPVPAHCQACMARAPVSATRHVEGTVSAYETGYEHLPFSGHRVAVDLYRGKPDRPDRQLPQLHKVGQRTCGTRGVGSSRRGQPRGGRNAR